MSMRAMACTSLTTNYPCVFCNSAVRDAMVSVMLATTPQRTAVPLPPLPPTEGAEAESDRIDHYCPGQGPWNMDVAAPDATLPRTTSTCLMWCAIALGALVRGIPLTHVGGLSAETHSNDVVLSTVPST